MMRPARTRTVGTERMAVEAQRKRAKRSPTFTAEELRILVGEVWLQRDTLFGGTNEKKNILAKNRVWSLIAQRLAPNSPCGLREWKTVRKKWQEFQSQTKKKAASVKHTGRGRGGSSSSDNELTPEEETALAILGKNRSEAAEVGVEVRVVKRLPEPKNEPCESGLGPGPGPPKPSTPSTDYDSDAPQLPPVPEHQLGPAITDVRTLAGHAQTTPCGCSETLVALEREKVEALRRIERHLERSTALQQEMVELKRQKLELQRRGMPLVEALSSQPANGRTFRRGVSTGRTAHATQRCSIFK